MIESKRERGEAGAAGGLDADADGQSQAQGAVKGGLGGGDPLALLLGQTRVGQGGEAEEGGAHKAERGERMSKGVHGP